MRNIELIKKLREKTGCSVIECKKAAEKAKGDFKKAQGILRELGAEIGLKKAGREASCGIVESYIHLNGKVGSIVLLCCETDFVARTGDFKELAHDLAMQICAMNPKDTKELLGQAYIKDLTKTIADLIKEAVAKLGEKIEIKEFKRFEIKK